MKAWVKLHAKQLAAIALWLAGVVVLHRWPQFHGDVETLSGALLLVGIQLPPFTLRAGAEAAAKLVGGVLLLVLALALFVAPILACTPATVAKDEYSAGLKACDDTSSTRAADDACKAAWRAKWDEAGAPPAAILDGGAQ